MSAETTPATTRKIEDRHLRDVRELALEAGISRHVTEEDVRAVIDWWLGEPDPGYRPLADLVYESPEYWVELKRRLDNPGRVLSYKTVREQLLLRWGEAAG